MTVAAIGILVAPGQATSAGADSGEIDEIIVTARKVAEDVYRVPISLTVLSGDLVDATGLDNLYELQFDVPGLVTTSMGLWGARIALRGVSDDGGSSPTVVTGLDGVALDQASAALTRLFDVERIEVLKGPQGTLYGRNATGGSINVISRSPESRSSAAFEGARGSFDTSRIEGYVNLHATNVAVRISGVVSEGEGFIRNSVDSRRFAEEDYSGLRASIRIVASEALTVDIRAQRVSDDGGTSEVWLPRVDHLLDPHDIYLTTVTEDDPFLATTDEVASVQLAYKPGRYELRSISAYGKSLTRNLDDCGVVVGLASCVRGARPDRYQQWSQEFQLSSPPGERAEWLVGAYATHGESLSRFFNYVPLRLPVPLFDYEAVGDRTAWAVFGQATRYVGPRWSVTGGLRISRENAERTSSGTGINDSPVPRMRRGDWDDTSWRLGAQFSPSDNSLFYASVATGFRAGGLSSGSGGEYDSYDPEYLTAYEAGWNRRSPEKRFDLRASAFVYDYEDMQVRNTVLIDTTLRTVIDNAAESRIHGLEIETNVGLGAGLALSAGAVWLPRREFVDFTSDVTGDVLSGNKLSRAPEVTATLAASYQRSLGAAGDLSVRLAYNHRSEFYFSRENNPVETQEGFGLLNLFVRFEAGGGNFYVFASGRNLASTEYFDQIFLQSEPGRPRTIEAGFGVRF